MRHADDTDTLDRFLLDRNGVGGHVEVTVDVEDCNLTFERMTTNDIADLFNHVFFELKFGGEFSDVVIRLWRHQSSIKHCVDCTRHFIGDEERANYVACRTGCF